MDEEKQAEITAKVKAIIASNEALEAKNAELQAELDTCLDTIDNIFGKLMNEKTKQFEIGKAMKIIANPKKLEKDVLELMAILEKYKFRKQENEN